MAITAEVRLMLTLVYIASGPSFQVFYPQPIINYLLVLGVTEAVSSVKTEYQFDNPGGLSGYLGHNGS